MCAERCAEGGMAMVGDSSGRDLEWREEGGAVTAGGGPRKLGLGRGRSWVCLQTCDPFAPTGPSWPAGRIRGT